MLGSDVKKGAIGGAIIGAVVGVGAEAAFQALLALPGDISKSFTNWAKGAFPNQPPPNWGYNNQGQLVNLSTGKQVVNPQWQPQPWSNVKAWQQAGFSGLGGALLSAWSTQWGSPPNPATGWPGSAFSVPPGTQNSQTNLWGQQVCPRGTIYDPSTNACVPGGQENF